MTAIMESRQPPNRHPLGRALAWLNTRISIARWAAVILFLVAWQASGAFLNPMYVSTPSSIVAAFFAILANGDLPKAFVTSLGDLAGGVLIGAFLGAAIGVAMGRIRLLERALGPLVAFGNASPTIALLPLIVVWLGIGASSRMAFVTTLVVWTFLVNTVAGVRAVRGGLSDVGKSLGLGPWAQTWHIYLPATTPYLLVGARLALAQGAIGMILAGQELGQSGLGGIALSYGNYFETAQLVATIGASTALVLFLFWVVRVLRDRMFPWIRATSAGVRGQ